MAGEKLFDDILSSKESRGAEALDVLVEQLNTNKERTIYNFLSNPGSEDVLWALIQMLSSKTTRIASNAAYVLGSLAETELGSHRILSILQITAGKKETTVLGDLTRMLTVEDAETVMNAAGTLGTLAETEEGRKWILNQPCFEETTTNITFLLGSDNNWTASNSALVLARITISEPGSQAILDHPRSKYILTRLIQSLGNDSAGRGMNAAFAIGRLLDTKSGKQRLLSSSESEKMISSLCRMLSKGDMGGAKNACFALSCLATDSEGNQRVLSNNLFQDVLTRLVHLLGNSDDIEAAWFAAMTLKTISTHKQGVIRLRQNSDVIPTLLKTQNNPKNSKELNEEIEKTLIHLKKLDQPDPPHVEILNSTSARVTWNAVNTQSGLQIMYKLFCDNKVIYKGQDLQRTVDTLRPFTSYVFKVRASTLGDDSPYSEHVTVMTYEDIPSAPRYLRVIGTTPTQLRLTWSSPENPNGILTGYSIFVGDKLIDMTSEMSYIISRLSPATQYTVDVRAATSTGIGDKATIVAVTEELGAHAPEKPTVTVIGRNEMHVAWMPPSVPLGRFFRYELCMNDRVVYQGTDKVFRATGLTPDTDYTFVVVAITSEGRCVSDPTKKRTTKDKPQNEPGHHQLKTHSFMAKEFQSMQEKSKSQSNILPPTQKSKLKNKKRNSLRPSSSVSTSNISDASALTDGTWALNTVDIDREYGEHQQEGFVTVESQRKQIKKYQNPAVLGGAPLKVSPGQEKRPILSQPATNNQFQTTTGSEVMDRDTSSKTRGNIEVGDGKANIQKHHQDVVTSVKKGDAEKTSPQALPKEFSFGKENNRNSKMSSSKTRQRARLHRGQAIMKGKKVLKSDKELLAEMSSSSKQDKSSFHQYKSVETGQRPIPYYPDIVSAIRKQYSDDNSVQDLINGKTQHRDKNAESPDSLNPEPGTGRKDPDAFLPMSDAPPMKHPLPHPLTRERHINEYQLHEYAKQRSYPYRSLPSYSSVSKLNSRSANDHVIIKSTPTSKFGFKYNMHGHATESSESAIDNDSAFQSLSSIHNGHMAHDAHSAMTYLHKPVQLQPIRTDNLTRASSERHLQGEESRAIPSRLKTPPKGYWSDHDVSPARTRKKAPALTPINYKKFQGAHRPTKSIRLESPLVTNSDTWFVADSVPSGDNNRYNFIPTQWRTQPANLPTHGKTVTGRYSYRLDSLNDSGKRLEATDKNLRSSSVTSGGASPSPPSRKRYVKNPTYRGTPKTTHDQRKTPITKTSHVQIHKDDISTAVHNLKTGSILAALNYHHGYDPMKSHPSPTRNPRGNSRLPSATATTIPHTVLSPLTPSEPTPSSSGSKISQSPKSPRLHMTSSSSSFYGSTIPTASGYAISPSHSLSPLLNGGDKAITHLQRQMALVPGGGDPV